MAKYKFDAFTSEITNPTIAIVGVHDLMNESCNVDITLTKGDTKLGVTLTGFTYSETWEDADITAFVDSKVAEYLI
jgi:hypothetical protein